MTQEFAHRFTVPAESTANNDGDVNANAIDEAIAFDEEGKAVVPTENEEIPDFCEDDLTALLDNDDNDDSAEESPTVLAAMASSRAVRPKASPSRNDVRNNVLKLVNQQRARYGISPLRTSQKLTEAAQSHSEDMARRRKMSHTGSDGSTVMTRVKRTDYEPRTVAENVARGQDSSRDVVKEWMNSRGHRKNILNSAYTEIGVGVVYGNGGPYWTQVFARR